MKNVVVTGVSTGIGKGIASVMIKQGWRVFGSVRKDADARALRAELGDTFVPLVFDIEHDDAIVAASAVVRTHLAGQTLDGLVNNAGSRCPIRCWSRPSLTFESRSKST